MTFIKNIVLFIVSKFYGLQNWFLLKRKKVVYETYPVINGVLFITGHGNLILGKNVQFNSSRRSNPIGGDSKLVIDLGSNGKVSIGDGTGISNAAIIAHNSITFGKNVKVGGSVKMYDTDFHSLDPIKRSDSKTDVPITKPIVVGDNAFIGAHSIILKGVSIGANSIVGAGSVVSKSIPDNQIWGGNPAKFLKSID